MKKVVGVVLGLLPVSVSAQCITPPDCASIGYTETSCEGDSLKCPFDTTKLYCPPCDSSYKYSCSGENVKNPIGDTCNNKYAACECIAGATFINGECICDNSCDTIGNIYYSDGSCSSCKITDKIILGIITHTQGTQKILLATTIPSMTWGLNQTDSEGNIIINRGDLPDIPNITPEIAKTDFNGYNNTQIIVNYFGDNAEGNAGVYCYNYTSNGVTTYQNQWYLPSIGELLAYVYPNKEILDISLKKLGTSLPKAQYWSSNEGFAGNGLYINISNGTVPGGYYKSNIYSVACLLRIE